MHSRIRAKHLLLCCPSPNHTITPNNQPPTHQPKRRNVLLSGDCRAFLGDLGLGLEVAGAARTAVGGSTLHAAPELLLGQRVTLAADLYSLGILLIALLTQEPVTRRGGWRLPRSPQECPQASSAGGVRGKRSTANSDCLGLLGCTCAVKERRAPPRHRTRPAGC